MEKRKTEDIYEVDGRKFILKKFDPLTGNYIMMQILSVALPFGIGQKLKAMIGDNFELGTSKMSKEEFIGLQKDILGFVSEKLEGNNAPIINDNGSYGVMDFTMSLSIQLIVAELAFNFVDFFDVSQFASGIISQ